jgi:glutamate racemase
MGPVEEKKLNHDLTIVVTDSGLGGLSVMAELEKNLRNNPIAQNIRLIFFNAVPDKNRGYNSMNSEEEKTDVFNSALEGMAYWYNPDIILIACNTLSVVYPGTKFASETKIKVLGIVDFGVALAKQALTKESNSAAVLLGTPTTINSGVHKSKLIERGFDSARIIEQPCHMLESAIQINPFSDTTRKLIRKYLKESGEKLTGSYDIIYPVFCCTHYGYSYKLFEEELKNIFSSPAHILNPNLSMSSYLGNTIKSKVDQANITAEVVSRVRILKEETDLLGRIVKASSEKVYASLINYHHKPEIF